MEPIKLGLQPKQSEVFTSDATEILYGGAAGAGKALNIQEKIPTPLGWKLMGELRVGDQVFDENGLPCNVVAATEVMFGRPCYRVTFSDGTEIICDEQHQWVTWSDREIKSYAYTSKNSKVFPEDWAAFTLGNGEKVKPKTTKELTTTKTHNKHRIPTTKPVLYSEKELPIDPYVFGYLLGDGDTSRSSRAACHPNDRMWLVETFLGLGVATTKHKSDGHFGVLGLSKAWAKLGLSDGKYIPTEYIISSVDQRLELVRGLMDSDGYIDNHGSYRFTNTNKKIVDSLLEVLKSLGIIAKVYRRVGRTRRGVVSKDSYEVLVSTELCLCKIPRKVEKARKLWNLEQKSNFIVNVEKVESVPVRCIQVDSPRNMFLCSESFIPTHNSHLMRVLAITYSAAVPGLQTYLFRRTLPDLLSNHMVGSGAFPDMLAPLIDSKHVSINWSKNEIRFWNGSIIHLSHCQHETEVTKYQGSQIGLLLLDEGTLFTETMYKFLRGRVRLGSTIVPPEYKGKLPKVVIGSNPGNIGHNWVKKTFIDYAPANVVVQTPPEEGGFKRVFIPARLTDNYALLENDPNYADRLKGLGDTKLVSAMLDGNWDIAEGGLFDDVWRRDIHVLEPFEIPSSWRIDRSFDWGSSKPFSVGFWAESDGSEVKMADGSIRHFPKGTLFRIAEIYGWNGEADKGLRLTAKEIATMILEFQEAKPWGKRVKPGPADSAIYTKENGNCIADDMLEVGVRWIPADKRPGSRVSGWQNMRKMLKAAMQSPVEDKALFIFNNCTQFIRTFPTLPRDKNNSDDCDSRSEDHIADEARYRCNMASKSLKVVATSGL